MGKSIYLDDNRPTPAGWSRAHTAEDAKLHLMHGDVDRMSLDYDLDAPHCDTCRFQCGHRETQKCQRGCDCHRDGDENGLHLLQWMHRTGRWPKERPNVHSANLVGAMQMKKFVNDHFPYRE